ncbi:facilitated trehalose transporter Tret1-like [Microplitis mediator]|uniref:facilitated trehalose transporter Tret1-like n=1 Tax=Microplitis mediator TaxID=375433 RepID=UPI0025573A26|nr:facilitated trehalose transporter Tret1-like [Microplitis mediator]
MFYLKNLFKNWNTWPQWFAAFDIFLIALVVGLENGWTSPSLAKLTSNNSTLPINEYQASWIASLLNTGRAFGAIIGFISTEYLGSKTSLIYNAFVHGTGMMCLLYAYSVNWLYASRFIVGLGSGMWSSIFPIYVGEISSPKIRGALVCLITIGMPIGFVLGNIIGAYTDMWLFGTISLIPILSFLILFMWFPKTPHYLVLNDQIDDALISIEWYQRDANAIIDLISIKKFVEEKRWLKASDYIKDLMLPFNRMALIKVNTVHFLLQTSGFCTIGYYMEIILTQAQVTLMDTALIVPTIAGTALIGGIISIYTCDKLGRKVLLSCSSIGMAFGMLGIGIYFHLLDSNFAIASHDWIPILFFIIIEFSVDLGIDPVLGTINSEIFSPNIKIIACCLTNFMSSIFAFIATQFYQTLVDTMSIQYVFYFYCMNMTLLALFVLYFLPETKGKTLQEIQDMMKKK